MTEPLTRPTLRSRSAARPARLRLVRASRPLLLWVMLVIGWASILSAPSAVAQEAAPNPTLRQVWLQAGIHRIRAEVAASPEERSRGLMLRKGLQPNHGMLFVFESSGSPCFWMKNTLIPLTIAFIAEDGEIATLADMQPHDETSHCPTRPILYALEMDQGWFRAKGVKVGDRIGGLTR